VGRFGDVTNGGTDHLAGLPDNVRRLLSEPPFTGKKLLELRMQWPQLSPQHARFADVLRLFVITWDPLEHKASRSHGFATVNIHPLELVVYVPIWSLLKLAAERDRGVATVLNTMGGAAVVTAAAHEENVMAGRYPRSAVDGAVPDLLSDVAGGSALGPAQIRLVSPGWEDIGLGAITDVVQHAFGPVDLDRSPVELAARRPLQPGCPACAGRRFGFPADLADSRDRMCPIHQREAQSVINRRLARANASNPDGWAALTDASARLQQPHLPNGLATKLAGADQAMYVSPEPAELAKRAELVIEAAGWFPGRPNELAFALGEDPDFAWGLPDWLINLVLDLGRAGLGAEAARVGEALARVDPDNRPSFDADVALALAQCGLAEPAQDRIAANLAQWPDNFWVRVHAGDALAALGDIDGAEAHYEVALRMADEADDFEARADAVDRLTQIRRRGAPEERDVVKDQRRQPKRKPSRSQRTRASRRRHKR
jgi:hypothetical protein